MGSRRAGFTLIELMVVLVIVLLVSVVTLPTVVGLVGERGIQMGAQITQAAIVAARDEAVRVDDVRGIRFIPDESDSTKCSRLVMLQRAGDYSEGLAATYPMWTYDPIVTNGLPCLVVEQRPFDKWVKNGNAWSTEAAPPTSWWNNVRVGDQIRIGTAGPWLTVCGPVAQTTTEGFTGASSLLTRDFACPDGSTTVTYPVEYLLLVNGLDDDGDGFIDNGYDGIDNDNDDTIDNAAEWEFEQWPGKAGIARTEYTIRRRPVPSRVVTELPAGVVIDLAGLPPQMMFSPTGAVSFTGGAYGTPSATATVGPIGDRQIAHDVRIHLIERGTGVNEAWVGINIKNGQIAVE